MFIVRKLQKHKNMSFKLFRYDANVGNNVGKNINITENLQKIKQLNLVRPRASKSFSFLFYNLLTVLL